MKNNPTQLELFNLHNQEAEAQSPKADPLQLAKVRGYQKAIFQVIAFIFVGLVSFSLGVGKGRKPIARVTPQETNAPFVPLNEAISGAAVSDKPQKPERDIGEESGSLLAKNQNQLKILKPQQGAITVKAQYTVQVASISRSENVKKELSRLENKGYHAFGLVKGKYTVICVGKFAAKDHAQNSLTKLKTKYPDCQIRKL
ncbi:MAG: hypothetical protein A3G37_00685 [Omnitrophica WOR_2 bacterium RIFCSPLOWO2_12_FULL_46_30]|nr:MAG: hypothetical protein A3D27_02930 [Omnitrophica WOR_2 bacterium RIFCSPHIGHO2_02_FULL_46_37]OGX43880.1 MAG: hypothetical protein A3H41_04625 [Omnitrophica WOR_2 bacterium RIFCSPLOWO2_02_FULL_45_28]OGX51289.1 MAG: hypothetical protein A3G37_00685 [Omnitrophica WOR_2 bacterium RIFCSPLOWO2_12_FULL_46_30]